MAYIESRSAPITIYSRREVDDTHDHVVSTRRSFSSMSPMGGAAGAMKKFLSRRRGTTNDGFNGGSECPPRSLQVFEIVGGNGNIAAGTMVYDDDSLCSPRTSPVKTSLTTNSPISPKSPTLHSMFGRFGKDKSASHSRLGSITDNSVGVVPPTRATSESKRLNRRSLSADSVLPFKALDKMQSSSNGACPVAQAEDKIHPWAMSPEDNTFVATPAESSANNESATTPSSREHGKHQNLLESDPEFYQSSVDFLNAHHSRNHTAEGWSNRNKRRTSALSRRQSESCLLNMISEQRESLDEHSCGAWHRQSGIGPSSESLLMPSLSSSPTQYYDSPQTRNLVRFYLANNEYHFDEMLESGFPSRSLRGANDDGLLDDSWYMTLRLTLTPWHARAEESTLYGPENTSRPPHLRSMVYKLFSRSSSSLLLSSPNPPASPVSISAPMHLAKDSISSTIGSDDLAAGKGSSRPLTLRTANITSPTLSTIVSPTSPLGEVIPFQAMRTPRGPSKDKGFKIIASPTAAKERPQSPVFQGREYQYLSPPLTPVQPRSGSLSAMSLPIYNNDEMSPIVPPRRKASTPALFYSAQGNISALSLPETIERPHSTIPTKSSLRKSRGSGSKAFSPNTSLDGISVLSKSPRYPKMERTEFVPPSARQQHCFRRTSGPCSDPVAPHTVRIPESAQQSVEFDSMDAPRYSTPPSTPPTSLKLSSDNQLYMSQRSQQQQQPQQQQPSSSRSRHAPFQGPVQHPHLDSSLSRSQLPTATATAAGTAAALSIMSMNPSLPQHYELSHYNLQQQQQRWQQNQLQSRQQQQQ
ncbi:hypothetical protein BG004_007057 [Podila humilis]|nr:hypothetical protein BG004_007057 [Podila humilis]